jgi:flagellar M-ring protein FliF
MATLSRHVDQLKQFWTGLSGAQRLGLFGGAAMTVAILLVFVRLIAVPEYKPLFTNLETADAQSLAAQLATKNIPHKLSTDGKTISVPASQVDAARLEVASAGMPRSGRLGFELFDKVSWGQTEFDEKVNYQRALEGELERTIQTLRDVEAARVHLVMPADSVFINRERSAKASVILKLRRGALSEETQRAISRLVSGAVDKLPPENVTVVDADTNRPLGHWRADSMTGGDLEKELAQKLLATLEPVAGPQKIRASVNVEYDPTSAEQSVEKYDPATTVALSTQRSEEQVGGSSAIGGIPGTASNVPSTAAGAQRVGRSEDGAQSSKTESTTYAVNKIVRRTIEPAGRIRRISAALLVDDVPENKMENGKQVTTRRKRSPEELQQLEELAKAAIGLDPSRGDVISVSNLSFDVPPPEVMPAPTRLQRVQTLLTQWSAAVRYGVLIVLFLLVYALLLRPIKRQALKTMDELPARQKAIAQAQAAEALGGENQTALLKKHITEKTRQDPAASGRLIQAWLREDA